jgi:predicted SAM-dependent methyltransferase
MRSQRLKTLYYASVGRLSVFSLWWLRLTGSGSYANAYVNVGCGTKYVHGMVNIDGNLFRKKDMWLDVTLGLPFPDNSLQGVYASHVIEHFDDKCVRRLFGEVYRVLKPGGAVRLIVPSLEYAIDAYVSGGIEKMPDWPHKYDSAGGRFNNFMLCQNQHFMMFDLSLLEELLSEAGFSNIVRESLQHSDYFKNEHMQFESDPSLKDVSLYIEAVKR